MCMFVYVNGKCLLLNTWICMYVGKQVGMYILYTYAYSTTYVVEG